VDDLAAIVERLWPGSEAALEALGGGITNHNFKVTVGGDTFVLRIGGKDTALLGIDRADEAEASRAAASIGIGPEVVAFAEGCLVTRFIEGRSVPPDELDPAAAGATIRLVHDGPAVPGRFDAFRVVEAYRRTAEARGVAIPAAYEEASRRAAAVQATRADAPLLPCHNDLLNANFLHDGSRLRIVDWEYAGMGDPMFDLGNFAANHELDEEGERALLEGYRYDIENDSENHSQSVTRALHDMRFMSDFREAMWGVVQQAISELDFDFAGYADMHFERALS
jgi:thiamine kinase-like enzyme